MCSSYMGFQVPQIAWYQNLDTVSKYFFNWSNGHFVHQMSLRYDKQQVRKMAYIETIVSQTITATQQLAEEDKLPHKDTKLHHRLQSHSL